MNTNIKLIRLEKRKNTLQGMLSIHFANMDVLMGKDITPVHKQTTKELTWKLRVVKEQIRGLKK